MANIFANQKDYIEKHKRNTFDLSFTNNLTFDFGQLVPVFCKEVIPGDSFRITPSFGLRLMPLVFPIQTRLNANLHFFYVRNRNLWKDWPDFIGRTKPDLVPPYLDNIPATNIKTGKLADYLGCPTTLVGAYGNIDSVTSGGALHNNTEQYDIVPIVYGVAAQNGRSFPYFNVTTDSGVLALNTLLSDSNVASAREQTFHQFFNPESASQPKYAYGRMFLSDAFDFSDLAFFDDGETPYIKFSVGGDVEQQVASQYLVVYLFVYRDGDWYPDYVLYNNFKGVGTPADVNFYDNNLDLSEDGFYFFDTNISSLEVTPIDPLYYNQVKYPYSRFVEKLKDLGSTQVRIGIASELPYNLASPEERDPSPYVPSGDTYQFNCFGLGDFRINQIRVQLKSSQGVRDITPGNSPYVGAGAIKISALPFRAYESIYNCFYRNQFNDPFILNGQKEYNKFIRSNDGGADNLLYKLENRNYELDFLTSARQSPVDGDITPLVGVNAAGKFTFKNADDTTYTVTPIIGDDGHTLTGIESMEGTPDNNSGLRRLVDMISLGISINDFRNVNALQRWLETNLRRGYRYKDQIMSHFGVEISYEELDMPEFIGGMSEPIIVNQVNQSVDQTGNPDGLGDFSKVLGSYAGQASIMAQSKHSISKYCDEHGFIIGILSVTPVPCYSQLLPKHLIKNNVLDYYFPEFGHIGNQPITYKEVCPIQVKAAGDSLDDVFGYQRPWYDYLASVDEVHGDFRLSLDGFLITRLFDTKPELGKKFIEVDKDSMTNPFSVTDDTNKIIGQVYFDVTAQRPIPKYGIPRLE